MIESAILWVQAEGLLMIGVAALAAAFSSHISVERYALGSWELRLTHDPFASETRCDLRSRHPAIIYRSGALAFQFPPATPVALAWYRVDAETAVRWSDRLPALLALGAPIDQGGLDNPFAGMVWIPAQEISSAAQVEIRPGPLKRVVKFKLGAFDRMMAAARRLGCTSEADFAS